MVMTKLRRKKQQFIRFLFGSFSFTTIMFAFQACYGVPENYYYIDGQVVSASNGEPIPNIQVYNNYHGKQFASQSDHEGNFFVAIDNNAISATLCFRDIDGDNNGKFVNLDTLVSTESSKKIIVTLHEKGANE